MCGMELRSDGVTPRRSLKFARKAGLRRLHRNPGPMPLEDHCGHGIAILMVLASLEGGKHCVDHTQFNTIRNYSAAFSNQFRTTADGSSLVPVMGDEDGKRKHFSSCPMKSEWFARFLLGCKLRMGQDIRQNQALGRKVAKAVLDLMLEETTEVIKNRLRQSTIGHGRLDDLITLFMEKDIVNVIMADDSLKEEVIEFFKNNEFRRKHL